MQVLQKSVGILGLLGCVIGLVQPLESWANEGAAECAVHLAPRLQMVPITSEIIVLDTNTFLDDPSAHLRFQNKKVVVPYQVVLELEKKKRDPSLGANARKVLRDIEGICLGGCQNGVAISETESPSLKVEMIQTDLFKLNPALDKTSPDDLIIAVALEQQKRNPDQKVIFVSGDIAALIKAKTMGLAVKKFEAGEQAPDEQADIYLGWYEEEVTPEVLARFKRDKFMDTTKNYRDNEFIILKSGDAQELGRYDAKTKRFYRLEDFKPKAEVNNIAPTVVKAPEFNPYIFTKQQLKEISWEEAKLRSAEKTINAIGRRAKRPGYVNREQGELDKARTLKTLAANRIEELRARYTAENRDNWERREKERSAKVEEPKVPAKSEETKFNAMGLVERNPQQRFALDLLLDRSVSLVTLTGGAGSGKTLLGIAAALQLSILHGYKIAVTHPMVQTDDDTKIGFLKGDIDAKVGPFLGGLMDNLAEIFSVLEKNPDVLERLDPAIARALKIEPNVVDDLKRAAMFKRAKELALSRIEIVALPLVRGRSFADTILIVEEAQNLTVGQTKSITTRLSRNSKIILDGDFVQTDIVRKNGFNTLLSLLRQQNGYEIIGHVHMPKSERSELTRIMNEIWKGH